MRSCAHAMARLTEPMRLPIGEKSTGQTCFVELQNAFAALEQTILLSKLNLDLFCSSPPVVGAQNLIPPNYNKYHSQSHRFPSCSYFCPAI